MLSALDTAFNIEDINLPGFRLHQLAGNRKSEELRWSITVSGNWRVTFEFVDGNVYVTDYEDYH